MREFLAFDLGAESGRAMRASLRGGVLTLAEVHRFPNGTVRDNGSQRWDLYRLWREMWAALRQCKCCTPREHRSRCLGLRLRPAARGRHAGRAESLNESARPRRDSREWGTGTRSVRVRVAAHARGRFHWPTVKRASCSTAPFAARSSTRQSPARAGLTVIWLYAR